MIKGKRTRPTRTDRITVWSKSDNTTNLSLQRCYTKRVPGRVTFYSINLDSRKSNEIRLFFLSQIVLSPLYVSLFDLNLRRCEIYIEIRKKADFRLVRNRQSLDSAKWPWPRVGSTEVTVNHDNAYANLRTRGFVRIPFGNENEYDAFQRSQFDHDK